MLRKYVFLLNFRKLNLSKEELKKIWKKYIEEEKKLKNKIKQKETQYKSYQEWYKGNIGFIHKVYKDTNAYEWVNKVFNYNSSKRKKIFLEEKLSLEEKLDYKILMYQNLNYNTYDEYVKLNKFDVVEMKKTKKLVHKSTVFCIQTNDGILYKVGKGYKKLNINKAEKIDIYIIGKIRKEALIPVWDYILKQYFNNVAKENMSIKNEFENIKEVQKFMSGIFE